MIGLADFSTNMMTGSAKDYRLIVEYNHEEKKSRIKFKFDQRTGESIPIIDPVLEE